MVFYRSASSLPLLHRLPVHGSESQCVPRHRQEGLPCSHSHPEEDDPEDIGRTRHGGDGENRLWKDRSVPHSAARAPEGSLAKGTSVNMLRLRTAVSWFLSSSLLLCSSRLAPSLCYSLPSLFPL